MNARELADKLEELKWERVRLDYSGRSMFGATCVAVDVDRITDLFRLGMSLGNFGVEVSTPRIDNMGMGFVVYWPTMKTEVKDEDTEEEAQDTNGVDEDR